MRGYEYPNPTATSTTYDHGGTIEVAVAQYGYGNDNGGTLGATQPTSVKSHAYCGSFANFHRCTGGETITGFMYFYTFTNSQGGYFTSSSSSVADPYGTHSDSIYIK
ncbi:MAG: DUF4879 domain-containing protein [Alteromonadaceae bacterium]|nr:DUF4879 domain-containing protein [Alteromonadaceae bacterium]